jgi:hypothetical protein
LRSSDGGQTTVGWGGLPQDVPLTQLMPLSRLEEDIFSQ